MFVGGVVCFDVIEISCFILFMISYCQVIQEIVIIISKENVKGRELLFYKFLQVIQIRWRATSFKITTVKKNYIGLMIKLKVFRIVQVICGDFLNN